MIAVDGAMIDAAIFEILDEIRGEEALADSALPLMTRLICLVMEVVRVSEVARIRNAWAADA